MIDGVLNNIKDGVTQYAQELALNFAFDFLEGAVSKLGKGEGLSAKVLKEASPILTEMTSAAREAVHEQGLKGVADEQGRLTPKFRRPFELRMLRLLSRLGYAEAI